MIKHQTPTEDEGHWVDHLQNAIDRACPTLTSAQSRLLAVYWDNIFQDAEIEQDACDTCEDEANNEMLNYIDNKLKGYAQ